MGTAHQVVGGAALEDWEEHRGQVLGVLRGKQGCWMTLYSIFIFDLGMQGSYSPKRQQNLAGKAGKPGSPPRTVRQV